MGTIREITQFGRLEYEMFKAQGRFDMQAPDANIAHVRETAMRKFDAMVADTKSEVNTKLGGVKNISRIRVYLMDPDPDKFVFALKLEFVLIKPLGMLEDERKTAERKKANEERTTKKAQPKAEKAKGPFKRPDKSAAPKKATFAKGKKGPRRPRKDEDESPFKPAELTGKTVPVERVILPQRHHH